MKYLHLTVIIIFSILVSSCNKSAAKKEVEKSFLIEQQLNKFLDEWHESAADADFDGYFNKIAPNGVYVGTDEEEVWSKTEFADFSKPFFDKGRAWDFTAIDRNIYRDENGSHIWFNETLNTWMGVCRGSGIITLNGETGQYEIQQYVLSLTVPNESIRQVMEVIDQTEEN